MGTYQAAFERSIEDPEGFWGEAAGLVEWTRPPTQVLDDSNPPFYRWYPDGEINTCFNALDRHVASGRADQAALIYDSPVTGTQRTYTYRELLDEVSRAAGMLAGLGVGKGDRVVIYMPMVPQAVISMLACARLGAVHSVVFGGFASAELATRIDDAQPKVILSASCGIEPTRVIEYHPLLSRALEMASHQPDRCVILQRDKARATLVEGRDLDWDEAMAGAEPADCVPVQSTDPLYILYTSGTTGKPKGIVRDNGGHAVALAWSMTNVFDVEPGSVYWAASDVGWVVGHSYIVYAPLLHGCTTVLYEGKPVGHTRRRGVLAGRRRARGHLPVHRPHGHPGHPQGGPGRRASWPSTTSPACGTCSWPVSASTRTRTTGPPSTWASPSSTTGGRRRADGRSAPTSGVSNPWRSRRARRRCPYPATGWRCSTPRASRRRQRRGSYLHQTPVASRFPPHPVAGRRALCLLLHERLLRLLPDR